MLPGFALSLNECIVSGPTPALHAAVLPSGVDRVYHLLLREVVNP